MTPKLSKTQKARNKQKVRAQKARDARAERDELISIWRKDGYTLESIAEELGITHQRVSQIINKSKEGGK